MVQPAAFTAELRLLSTAPPVDAQLRTDWWGAWVLEKQVHGRLYTTRLAVGNEKDALAELALFRRDPAAYVARAQEAKATVETTSGNAPVLLGLPTVERFLRYLKSQGRTKRHRKNVLHTSRSGPRLLYGKDLRQFRLQDLKDELLE